jgi:hypothetical protein
MNQFVTFALFLFLVTLVNSAPLIMDKRQIATPFTPVLLLTNQQSLDMANEAANSNQLDISATNENEYANSYNSDQADNLIVSKRDAIPYAEINIHYPHFTVKRGIPNSNVEKRLARVGAIPALGLIGAGSTITNVVPFSAGGSVNGLAASRGSFASANVFGF